MRIKFQAEPYTEEKVTVLRHTCLIKAPWLDDNSSNRYSAANFLSISTINEFLLRCLSLTRSPFARARSCKNQREMFLFVLELMDLAHWEIFPNLPQTCFSFFFFLLSLCTILFILPLIVFYLKTIQTKILWFFSQYSDFHVLCFIAFNNLFVLLFCIFPTRKQCEKHRQ